MGLFCWTAIYTLIHLCPINHTFCMGKYSLMDPKKQDPFSLWNWVLVVTNLTRTDSLPIQWHITWRWLGRWRGYQTNPVIISSAAYQVLLTGIPSPDCSYLPWLIWLGNMRGGWGEGGGWVKNLKMIRPIWNNFDVFIWLILLGERGRGLPKSYFWPYF